MVFIVYVSVIGVDYGDGIYAWSVVDVPLFLLLDPYINLKLMFSQGEYVE